MAGWHLSWSWRHQYQVQSRNCEGRTLSSRSINLEREAAASSWRRYHIRRRRTTSECQQSPQAVAWHRRCQFHAPSRLTRRDAGRYAPTQLRCHAQRSSSMHWYTTAPPSSSVTAGSDHPSIAHTQHTYTSLALYSAWIILFMAQCGRLSWLYQLYSTL